MLVATSAFGEGVDIPGVRHVVLYHLPFSEVEFNQMAGRAGRDGQPAQIHLLFGRGDAQLNAGILDDAAPTMTEWMQIYRGLRTLQQQTWARLFYPRRGGCGEELFPFVGCRYYRYTGRVWHFGVRGIGTYQNSRLRRGFG